MRKALPAAIAAATTATLLAFPQPALADTPAADRIAVLEGGNLFVKEGALDASWEFQESGVTAYQLDSDRVGVLKSDGSLLVKEGDLAPGWYTVNADSVTDFQLRDGRIAFTEGEDLYVVDADGIDSTPVHQADNVAGFAIEGDRVAVLTTDGDLLVKEGDLGPGWVTVSAANVTAFDLEDDRIAYTEGTDLYAQEGDLDAPSVLQDSDVVKFQLSGDRVGALTSAGDLLVKGGDLEPGWEQISANGVTDFKLDGDRIAYTEGDDLWAQEGDLDAASLLQEEGVSAFDIDGDRVAVVKGGELLAKEGDLEPGWLTIDEDSATGVSLLAATHAPPSGQLVTFEDLKAIYGNIGAEAVVREGLPSLNQAMVAGQIDNPRRMAAFLATLRNESGFRYNAGEAGQTGTYRGRGFIQLTSNANYTSAGNYLGVNLVGNPDLAASLTYSAPIAQWYWTVARSYTNAAADALDMGRVDAAIGYAPNAREDVERCNDFKAALRYFNGGELPVGAIDCVR
ncbi:glycoside hydrolase family 19 protein [Actinokineospora globicatena]|uniref:Glycoside hydrolase family 19 catalytic domain-containing protein n=1 Tax=Actinokineospora globicatena TaxID=103729 RepID=A0A9W6QL32_9PSEU|nr:glycoside hydrolase family 19 protein [Actinokineospora globicatena]MCP2302988.1 putative chitinase [Actinokineospora globicatena]GLW79905.1 hypothetical protein Aglo01_43860 [Actinokineospora globicatena]GLW85685.1 hypothetical protein Aglo02_33250 [Actinokineospora globicatena]GLW90547.1 hypothetical protein Aglo03_13630 [Actinokineospora globicatena]